MGNQKEKKHFCNIKKKILKIRKFKITLICLLMTYLTEFFKMYSIDVLILLYYNNDLEIKYEIIMHNIFFLLYRYTILLFSNVDFFLLELSYIIVF